MRRAVRAIVVKDDKLLVMRRNKFGQEYYILGLRHGFPKEPVELNRQYLEDIHSKVKKG